MLTLNASNTEFVVVAFEGPDPYAQAGGLGVRMAGLTRALAHRGFRVHFFFIGDPNLPGVESHGALTLYRWGQWISRYHQEGVYAAEIEKKVDLDRSLPYFIRDQIARPAIANGKHLVVLSEEWQTSETAIIISDVLYEAGLRDRSVIFWNANHKMGWHRINFARLGYIASITTVSQFMRHLLQQYGVNPIVIPNGIEDAWFDDVRRSDVVKLRQLFSRPLLVKVGRFDPDKRWIMAIEALAHLKQQGVEARLIMRGGVEPHGGEVFHRARQLGLRVAELFMAGTPTKDEVLARLESDRPNADIIHLRLFVPRDLLSVLYRTADAVLVNSGFEPFGLVGLEVMASGGVAITGGTGEDYARAFVNCLVVEDDNPRHLADLVQYAMNNPEFRSRITRAGRATARTYHWDRVLDELLAQITLAFQRQHPEGENR
jgi:glycosyltransferase involved in cell wall biosynthesis